MAYQYFTHTDTHTHRHRHTHTHTHTHIHPHPHTPTPLYPPHAHPHSQTPLHTHTDMHPHTHTCTEAHTHMHAYKASMYAHIDAHTQTHTQARTHMYCSTHTHAYMHAQWHVLTTLTTSPFCSQDSNLTWNSSWPEFTDCFQKTALIGGPCAFLWMVSLFYGWQLVHACDNALPTTRLSTLKMVTFLFLHQSGKLTQDTGFNFAPSQSYWQQ